MKAEPTLEHHAALLRDELFNTVSGMVNTQCCAALWAGQKVSRSIKEDYVVFDSQQPLHILDTPVAASAHSHSCKERISVFNTLFKP